MKNSTFHDILIRENRGNDGLRTMKSSWPLNIYTKDPKNIPVINHCTFYNLDIELRENGAWGTGQPNEDIAFWNCYVENCELFNCRFREKFANQGSPLNKGAKSIRVHHNQFQARPSGKNYTYHIEFDADYSEIDHNIFVNGIYPLASFDTHEPRINANVHHNLFIDTEGVDIVHAKGGLEDFRFNNNLVLLSGNLQNRYQGQFPLLMVGPKAKEIVKDISIENNVFISEAYQNDYPLVVSENKEVLNASINNNFFEGWSPGGNDYQKGVASFSRDDYRLPYHSEAFKIGYENIDSHNFGLNKDYFFAQADDALERLWIEIEGDTTGKNIGTIQKGEKLRLTVWGRTVSGFLRVVQPSEIEYNVDKAGLLLSNNGEVTAKETGIYHIQANFSNNSLKKKASIWIIAK